jgi:uncharacterized NAD-dependent epimerase/dehydratase family protein
MTEGKPKAIIITNGSLGEIYGKTAHGLIRKTDRYNIIGVIDHIYAGLDAGEVIDGQNRGIPIYATIDEFMQNSSDRAEYAIIGVAIAGGHLPEEWGTVLLQALENGISIVNGLHQPLNENPVFTEAAERQGVQIMDIRKPLPFNELRFWNGEIFQVKTPRIAVLGMDCAIGKRTTGNFLVEMCRANGIRTEMIFTGQTGWLQGHTYGFIFDSTPNDFICGEIERTIVTCQRESSPDLILIEGQSGLRNPAGPCGSEFLLSGNIKGVILQCAPFRAYFEEQEHLGCRVPDIEDEINLIKAYGAEVLAVTLNNEGASDEEFQTYKEKLAKKLKIPVAQPLHEGVLQLLPAIHRFMEQST